MLALKNWNLDTMQSWQKKKQSHKEELQSLQSQLQEQNGGSIETF